MVQNATNIPLGAKHHHMALRVENNQSRRRPTSWSLSKLPDSDLYLSLLSRGKTFPLFLSETDDPIFERSRKKVESLSLLSSSLSFPFLPSFPLYRIFWSKVKWDVLSCHMSHSKWLPWITPYPLSIYHRFPPNHMLPHVSHGSHLSSCLTRSQLDTWLNVSHSTPSMCHVSLSVPQKTWNSDSLRI